MKMYFDNAATTKVSKKAAETAYKVMTEDYGNPSSVHNPGIEADKILKKSRNTIANYLKTKPEQIIFTSGGTEANNLAIQGAASIRSGRGRHIISSQIEHPSIYKQFDKLRDSGYKITLVEPDSSGIIQPEDVIAEIRDETILISVMYVNNITGAIQPIREISKKVKNINHKIIIHSDMIQALGKIDCFPGEWKIDLASFSGHKLHGPKGTGFLYLNQPHYVNPILFGGGQEQNLRSGTENLPGIAGMAKAIEELEQSNDSRANINSIKKHIINKIKKEIPEIIINTPGKSAPHIINISVPGIPGEVIVNALNHQDIYISSGSACAGSSIKSNHVLEAMGLDEKISSSSVRISLSKYNTQKEAEQLINILKEELNFLL
ncbi:MAG: cysteine desulfurase family protein [Halanaerobiaceae bacterium]